MTKQTHVKAGNVTFGNDLPFALIAGPCQMESRQHALDVAGKLAEICAARKLGLVYKTSYDKANRTSLGGKRGLGLEKSLAVFEEVKKTFGIPVLTDVHEIPHCAALAPVIDILQIPAFLCRQTDLLIAAAQTGRVVNVKKGQFLAPWDMKNVVAKVVDSGNSNVMLTERGVSFGYNTLVNDMRALPIMAQTGYPVIIDATHSVQQPGGDAAVVRIGDGPKGLALCTDVTQRYCEADPVQGGRQAVQIDMGAIGGQRADFTRQGAAGDDEDAGQSAASRRLARRCMKALAVSTATAASRQ